MKRIILLVCVAGLAISSMAQGGRLPQPAGGIAAPSIDPLTGLPNPPSGPRFDIDFPGGGAADLIKAIENESKTRPNVMIHPECASYEIPPFRLREVTASQIFNTLNSLAEPDYSSGVWRQVPMQDGEVWTLTKFNAKTSNSGMMGGIPPYGQPTAPPVPRSCKIFNLTPYLEAFTVEDITTAVQGAWDLLQGQGNPSIKYHKDTRLLIVVGATPEINVVADVLQQLAPAVNLQRGAGQPAPASASPTPAPSQKAPAKP
jgi:hypothetical protein